MKLKKVRDKGKVGVRFRDIVPFTRWGTYAINQSWDSIERWLKEHKNKGYGGGIDLNPDFQRGHVWTQKQKRRFIEYGLRGGLTGMDVYFNCPGWNKGALIDKGPFVLVDGKQRIQAVRDFFKDKVKIFGGYVYSDFIDKFPWTNISFRVHINDLETRAEVLRWYLDLNSAGTVHTTEELSKVRRLMKKEKKRHGRS